MPNENSATNASMINRFFNQCIGVLTYNQDMYEDISISEFIHLFLIRAEFHNLIIYKILIVTETS